MGSVKNKLTIGRLEYISFPELGLDNIEAKIDTGAYTTALHCHDIYLITRNNQALLCFKPLGKDSNTQEFCTSEFVTKDIKNSFGETETRYIIRTTVRIGRKKIKASISLTDRGNMRYPVLIGRRILKGRFIVDVSHLFLTDNSNQA